MGEPKPTPKRSGLNAGVLKLTRIRRGVQDVLATAEFYAWLFALVPVKDEVGFRLRCANGEIVLDGDSSRPIAMEWSAGGSLFNGSDPDGIPVTGSDSNYGMKFGE